MVKLPVSKTNSLLRSILLSVCACLSFLLVLSTEQEKAYGIGFISHTTNRVPKSWQSRFSSNHYRSYNSARAFKTINGRRNHGSHRLVHNASKSRLALHSKSVSNRPIPADYFQQFVTKLQSKQILPGVIYRKGCGAVRLNVLDIDIARAPVLIKPIIAPEGAPRLQTVNEHASATHALAAVNANYFKKTGVALGTLVIDGDWIAGPLYDRVALGINKAGYARIDRVSLHGTLCTSNQEAPKIWINNINTPRRTGCRTVAYTRRWGNYISLPFDGSLVAIDAQGRVVSTDARSLTIPYGGLVLSDSENSALSALQIGDQTYLRWQVTPDGWNNIAEAVSGGPMLIKDNQYCIDLQQESFRKSWTSNNIKARTACGITANNHLLLITAEGTHTLYNLAHILHELGAVDAMNLDGGGSSTMVIHDSTVNMASKSNGRKVAAALGIFAMPNKDNFTYDKPCTYIPRQHSLDIVGNKAKQPSLYDPGKEEEKIVQETLERVLNLSPEITAQSLLKIQPVAN